MTIHDLNPQRVWRNFHSLTQIPRPSAHTAQVAAFLVQFGKDNGLESFQDECGNVIIRKPATPGMENRKGIILQAHMDMVPQKNNDKVHDFTKDPITTVVKGDWLYADGTTLGADDGLGVAAAMAVLEAKDLQHGPIEALFTVDEETRMVGAKALKAGVLNGDILLNLDSETEGELYVGCAGGLDANVTLPYTREAMPSGYKAIKIIVTGLRGGHSGMEINEGRGNANKVMARLLLPILRDNAGKLIYFNGGNMRNAIPRESEAAVAIPEGKLDAVIAIVNKTLAVLKTELAKIDPNVIITAEPSSDNTVIEGDTGLKLVKALYVCPNGVDRMSLEMPGLVDTSNNLAIVKTADDVITVNTLLRGSTDTMKMDLAEGIRAAFEMAGADIMFDGGYSGWSPNLDSPILHTMMEQYKNLYGVEPAVMAIHAGLECGIFSATYPNWDMISCGPTLKSPHSPDERCYIPSVEKWWNFIVKVLADAPMK